jgi:hypothetical protein
MICAVMVSAAMAGRNRYVTLQPPAKAAAIDNVVAIRFITEAPQVAMWCAGNAKLPAKY